MEPKAAVSAVNDFISTTVPPLNAPDASAGAKAVGVSVVVGRAEKASVVAPEAQAKKTAEKPADAGPQPGDLRLVIDQDPHSKEYIYKTVDRRTGKTLQQFPREEILKLRETADYISGKVYDGKA